MSDALARALAPGIVPVVVAEAAEVAAPLAEALEAAGVATAEVTLRTSAAPEVIRRMVASSSLVVGAGTVRTAADVDAVVEAGAAYVVSPGLSRRVVERCREHGVPVLPGVATPTEAMAAAELGAHLVKFFPAEANGGVGALRALSAALPGSRFVPTGGITAASLRHYLEIPEVVACGGSWMVTPQLLDTGAFDVVRRLSLEAVAVARVARGTR
ncbi:bifunctional 4-hydroxy-2-oxoglutarate aldolase/2-dehydro-3-deoxy-phosphogluconate aldolase [Nocardioides sp. NPDC092400]|uniref:bifunctional 4-hydroxy-2-oxoglutarate aldolase/2-dehydro-3-deoxy-phosphogluconate aldolase n=1 Tax=Nocardioides sp. NPDC092400 TaxID=3155196 RepID=UPI003438D808